MALILTILDLLDLFEDVRASVWALTEALTALRDINFLFPAELTHELRIFVRTFF